MHTRYLLENDFAVLSEMPLHRLFIRLYSYSPSKPLCLGVGGALPWWVPLGQQPAQALWPGVALACMPGEARYSQRWLQCD